MLSPCVATGDMDPWITEWSMSTMELKVFLNSKYSYLAFLFLFVSDGTWGWCSPSVLTCRLNPNKKRVLRIQVADMSCLFQMAHPNRDSCPVAWQGATRGASNSDWHASHASGGISVTTGVSDREKTIKHAGWITSPSKYWDASESNRSTQEEFKQREVYSTFHSLLLFWPGRESEDGCMDGCVDGWVLEPIPSISHEDYLNSMDYLMDNNQSHQLFFDPDICWSPPESFMQMWFLYISYSLPFPQICTHW